MSILIPTKLSLVTLLLFFLAPGFEPSEACVDVCDLRSCPQVPAAECEGTIVKDECNCCPVCQPAEPEYEFYDDVEDGMMTPSYVNASHKELCAQITCSRLQTCTVNIQGIPICRCPSAIFCRQQKLRRRQGGAGGGPVCAMDGLTYRSRCFLRMKECTENKRIKVNHEGQCFKRKGGKKRKGTEDANGMEKARRKDEKRRENRKQIRKNEKLMQRQLRQEEKKERRREEQKALKKQERRGKKKAKKDEVIVDRKYEKKSPKKDAVKKKRRQRRRLRRRIASSKNKRGKKFRGRRSCDGNDLGHDTIDTIVI